jgi:selenocysteine lyase/cysteine desulfurase
MTTQTAAAPGQLDPGCRDRIHLNNAGAALMPQPVVVTLARHLAREAAIGGYEAAEEAAAPRTRLVAHSWVPTNSGLVRDAQAVGAVCAEDRDDGVLDMDQKGVKSLLRLSPHYYNTEDELDAAVAALAELARP